VLEYIEEILKSYGFIFYKRYSTNDNEGYEKIENKPKEDDEETHPIIYDDTEKYEMLINDFKNGVEIEETKNDKQLMNRL
jgi:hypothetical protein